MKNIIFIAPPAAGKGTQSEMLCNKYNIPHISTGSLLRKIASEDEEKKKYIESQTQSGKLVSDGFIYEILSNRLKKTDCNNGYILDGFPRNVAQAKAYDEILKKLDKNLGYVFLLDVDYELSRKRIVGRLSCPNCGMVYNSLVLESKPKIDNVCDVCNTELVKRQDDNDETFKKRYDVYMKETAPLISYYEKKGNLFSIDANNDKNHIFEQIDSIISK